MDIKVVDSLAAENVVANYKIQWELRFGKYRSQFLLSYIVYVSFIVIGMIEFFKYEQDADTLFTLPVDALFLAAGSVALYFTIHRHRVFASYHKDNLKHLNIVSEILRKGNNEQVIQLTDEYVSIENFKSADRTGWEYFSHYSIHNEMIILHQNTKIIQNFVIKPDQVTASEYEDILVFVKNRLERF